MDTLVRGRMKPEDSRQSADTCRSLLEAVTIFSHGRAINLPETPGQTDPLNRAVGLLMGSFDHPPVPNSNVSYAKEIYLLLPKDERMNDSQEILKNYGQVCKEINQAHKSGPIPKELKQRAAVSSLRVISLLGSKEKTPLKFKNQIASAVANIIRNYHLGEEIGEAIGMKFEGKAAPETETLKSLQRKVFDRNLLHDEQGFAKGEEELAQIKEFILTGEGDKPLRMAENLTSLSGSQREGLTLRKIVEQVKNQNDLRVLATNGQVSIYALRIPHPEQDKINIDFNMTKSYLNLIVAVGPNCEPVVLKDSSVNEYENGKYNNDFSELKQPDEDGFFSLNFYSDWSYPSRKEGIFTTILAQNSEFYSAGKYLFISNEGELVESPESSTTLIHNERLPSGDHIFYIRPSLYQGGYYVRFNPKEKSFRKIVGTDNCNFNRIINNLGIFTRDEQHPEGSAVVLIDKSDTVTQIQIPKSLHADVRPWQIEADNLIVINLKPASDSICAPSHLIISMHNGHPMPGYTTIRNIKLPDYELFSYQFDPKTRTIISPHYDPFTGLMSANLSTKLVYKPPQQGEEIGWWMIEEPEIYDQPEVELETNQIYNHIFSRLARLSQFPDTELELTPPNLENTGIIHPDKLYYLRYNVLFYTLTDVLNGTYHADEKIGYRRVLRDKAYDKIYPHLRDVMQNLWAEMNKQLNPEDGVPKQWTPAEIAELKKRRDVLSKALDRLPITLEYR